MCTEKTGRVSRGFYYRITVGTLYSIIIQYLVACNTPVTKKVRMDLMFTIHKKRSSISSVCSYGTLPVVLLKPIGNNSLDCGSQIGPVPALFGFLVLMLSFFSREGIHRHPSEYTRFVYWLPKLRKLGLSCRACDDPIKYTSNTTLVHNSQLLLLIEKTAACTRKSIYAPLPENIGHGCLDVYV